MNATIFTHLGLLSCAANICGLPINVSEADSVGAMVNRFFVMNMPEDGALERQNPLFDVLCCYCQERVKKKVELFVAEKHVFL